MTMTSTTRVKGRLQGECPGGMRHDWILYLAVSSLVITCLWTATPLRDSVSTLECGFLAMMGWMYGMSCTRRPVAAEVAPSSDVCNLKAVQT